MITRTHSDRQRWSRPLAAMTLAALVAGCGGLFGQNNGEPVQSYMFSPRQFEQVADVDAEVILLVATVQSVGHDHQQMAYTMRPYERTHYAFSRWADTPPRMIEPLVVQAMEASGLFKAVVDVTSSVPADYRIDLDLLVLQHEFHTTPSQGRIVLRAQLNHVEANRIIGTRIFQASAPAASENAYGGVLAINLALESLLEELAGWVNESVRAAEERRLAEPIEE